MKSGVTLRNSADQPSHLW